MSQLDSETDAALAQLDREELSTMPGGEFAQIIGDLLALIGTGGLWAVAGGTSNLLLKVRRLAGASYASNLIFAITAVRNDLEFLCERHAELRERIESLRTDPKFAKAVAALALHAMHTSVKDRLKRIARIAVNGVKEDDLEPESLDDMMRAAVELTEGDIVLLRAIYEKQIGLLRTGAYLSAEWSQQVAANWSMHFNHLDSPEFLHVRSSLARLQSLGLVAPVETMMSRNGSIAHQPFGMVLEGKKFYERLQDLATDDRQAT